MLTPLQNAREIILNDPALAVPLIDFMLWAVTPGAARTSEFDEIFELLYAKTPDSKNHRDYYAKVRIAA
jgi:hypothetical protein